MLASYLAMLRWRWLLWFVIMIAIVMMTTIIIMPKDMRYASPTRFVLVVIFFAILPISLLLWFVARRKFRAAKRRWRYAGASAAISDTLSFLNYEEQLAWQGQIAILVLSLISLGFYVSSFWPQMATTADLRPVFGLVPVLGVLLALAGIVRNRRHMVNAFFLKRYLRQEVDHIAFEPRTNSDGRKLLASLKEKPVTISAPHGFRAGGFVWTLDDFYKNAIVFGQPGSGKTVCVLNSLLEGVIAATSKSPLPISGLILDPKGDFRGKIEALCRRYGRDDDLFVLDPDSWETEARTPKCIAWNPLDNVDDALEVSDRLVTTAKLLGAEHGDQSFFVDSAKVFMQHATTLLRAGAGDGCPSLGDVHRLCSEPEKQPILYQSTVTAIAERWPPGTIIPYAVTDAIDYFEQEWAHMAPNQKSGVVGTVTQLLNDFRVDPFRDLFSGRSTITISEVIDSGKILYIAMPSAKRERMAKVETSLVKLEFARQILLRPDKPRPSFLLCDEFQTFFTSGEGRGDSDFFERSRQSRHANIVAAQNVSSFHKRVSNAHDVKNFLGNCAVKIFLRNTEQDTNRWASGLFGERSEIVVTTNEQATMDGHWSRRRHTSYNRSNQMVAVIPPEAFHQLAIPERGKQTPSYSPFTETIVHLASRGAIAHKSLFWPVNPVM